MRSRGVLALIVAVLLAGGYALAAQSREDTAKRKPAKPLVVVLLLDELPLDSLLTPNGSIDAARFPNFAALAGTSTWFRNATTVYDSTFKAVPAILDAKLPERGTPPDLRGHRRNIYTFFDQLKYRVVDTEPATALCPPRICRGARTRRPGVLARLNRGGRPARMRRWIASIRTRSRPTLYLQHALLPHEPWLYLPSGRQARPAGNDPVEQINTPRGFHDPDLTLSNHQRYLLQLGFADLELGRLMARLRSTGLLDRALLVVAADHGYSFEIGTRDRRRVSKTNVEEIAPVPLFIKARGQRTGSVNDAYVRTIDILPTVAAQLGYRLPWRHDGVSAYGQAAQRRQVVRITKRGFDGRVVLGAAELQARRRAMREARARSFGTGFESGVRFGSPWASVYRIGPHQELLGTRPRPLRTAAGRARIANSQLLRSVNPRSRVFPTRVTGELSGGASRGERRDLAVVVNGEIAAVGRSFYLRGSRREWFSLMLPESTLRRGRNRVELFEVAGPGKLLRLNAS